MSSEIDMRELAAMLRVKRGKRSLRAVAEEIGEVSASTLLRVERGQVPDLGTFARLCRWLEVSPQKFMPDIGALPERGIDTGAQGQDTADIIVAHLRADRTLDSETAEALAHMIQLAYHSLQSGQLGRRSRRGR